MKIDQPLRTEGTRCSPNYRDSCQNSTVSKKGRNLFEKQHNIVMEINSKVDFGATWQVNKSLADSNRFMLENEIACDVTFLVGSERCAQSIKAHKYILAARSPVFFAMLYGDLASRNEEMITITDVPPEAFSAMLMFLYSEDCLLTSDLVLPTLYASKKYIIPTLTECCTSFLEENLHPDNVCLIYEQCILYEEASLKDKCRKFIEMHTEDIVTSPAFLDLNLSAIENILRFESLTVGELQLYRSCIEWSKKECSRRELLELPENQRACLGNALNFIHFPTMAIKEFANEVSVNGIMTSEDRCIIFEYLASDEEHRKIIRERMKFPWHRRRRPEPLVLRRFITFGKSNIYSGDCSMMRILCDQPIIIKGFGVSGSMGFDALAEVQVTIKQDRNFLINKSCPITDDQSGEIIQVTLLEPLLLAVSTWYTIIITFHFFGDHDQGSCKRGKGGSKAITCEGVNFEFDRSDSGSLIPEVLFSRVP